MGYLITRETSTGAFRRRVEPGGLGGALEAISHVPGIRVAGRPGNGQGEKVLYILKGIVAQTVRSRSMPHPTFRRDIEGLRLRTVEDTTHLRILGLVVNPAGCLIVGVVFEKLTGVLDEESGAFDSRGPGCDEPLDDSGR